MENFVDNGSIVRKIWGKSDTVLFIFAGAAAEFALNRAVDWLYFTGRLPADPIGRLFSTVTYARKIIFASDADALAAIDKIASIHKGVESARGAAIPDWAYRDVLFMLIHYSIAAYQLLERRLSQAELDEVYHVFYRVGTRMGLTQLPATYSSWLAVREQHMADDLQRSRYTDDLFLQYKKHLGDLRYAVLKQAQLLVIPEKVRSMLDLGNTRWLRPAVPLYKFSRLLNLDGLIKTVLLPRKYKQEIAALDMKSD